MSSLQSPSVNFTPKQKRRTRPITPVEDISTSAIEFNEFSFWDDNEGFGNVSREHETQLLTYLGKEFGVYDIHIAGPYLVLYCNTLPAEEDRPFTIAGCVTVWLGEDEGLPAEIGLGDVGDGEDLAIDDELASDLHPYRIPSLETFVGIARYSPQAYAITFLNTGLIIEMPKQDLDAYHEYRLTWPGLFKGCGISLNYHNGPLESTETKRTIKKPKPEKIDRVADETNYVGDQGFFSPGAMLSSTAQTSVSAGILLSNGEKSRLTVPFHCWKEEYARNGDNLGDKQHFHVYQGDTQSGSLIGHISERFKESDIGLVELDQDVIFSNRWMELDGEAKELIPSTDIKFNEDFLIDGFVTGRQRLKCLGRRIRVVAADSREKKDFVVEAGSEHLLSPSGSHIAFNQGIHATSSPIIQSVPTIREGVCGSALVRLTARSRGNVLTEGGVAGFMQYTGLEPKTTGEGQFHCYVEALDELIAAGWKMAPLPFETEDGKLAGGSS